MVEVDLVRELESLGISVNDWKIAKPHNRSDTYSIIRNDSEIEIRLTNWDGNNWFESKETKIWVVETCLNIVEQSKSNANSKFIRLDVKALARLSGMCASLNVEFEGLDILSKDVAIVASGLAKLQNIQSFDLHIYLQLMIYRGRYLDCIVFFRKQLLESKYDETFLPDIVDMLININELYQYIIDIQPEEFNNQFEQGWALGNVMVMATTISRGALLQLESGLGIISISMANQFITDLIPHISAILLRYENSEWSNTTYTHNAIKQSMFAYSSLMIGNLTSLNIAYDAILDGADKACMDGVELESREVFHTLFGHIIRLRVLASTGIKGSRWDNAVNQAEKAIQQTESLADVSHRQASLETIMSLVETGRIGDMQLYAADHSRNIDFL
tara:strand:+ start:561 stop:1727 length:1167 start_codon:yes stop_codon:yes gene_type:complete